MAMPPFKPPTIKPRRDGVCRDADTESDHSGSEGETSPLSPSILADNNERSSYKPKGNSLINSVTFTTFQVALLIWKPMPLHSH